MPFATAYSFVVAVINVLRISVFVLLYAHYIALCAAVSAHGEFDYLPAALGLLFKFKRAVGAVYPVGYRHGNLRFVALVFVFKGGALGKFSAALKAKNPRALFHSDGVQAYGKLPFRLGEHVDMYSVSAHKIGGLKGTGALIKKKKLVLQPFIWGGGQESGLRSGTENVYGIKAFCAAAAERYNDGRHEVNYNRVRELQARMWELLDKSLFERISPGNGSPYILTVAARGVRGETILHMCNDRGLIIGTGSACSSNASKRNSRVMQACGIGQDMIDGVLRISFNPHNTIEEVEEAATILNEVVETDRELTE